MPKLGEFEVIRRYFAPLSKAMAGSFNLEDDAAILTTQEGYELVVTTDAIVEGVHFLSDDPPDTVAAKLLRVNLSDLAAMGAAPLAYLFSAAWRRDLPQSWIKTFAEGLEVEQKLFSVHLTGGDTVVTNGPLVLSLTAFGEVPIGKALRRNGARVDDVIMVSGTIGDAGAGLEILQGTANKLETAAKEFLIQRYRRPTPRLELGQILQDIANSCIDISDGFLADLGHICIASGLGAMINVDSLPLSSARKLMAESNGAWSAGDDYELLFTVLPENVSAALDAGRCSGVTVSEVGRIVEGSTIQVINNRGEDLTPLKAGFAHF